MEPISTRETLSVEEKEKTTAATPAVEATTPTAPTAATEVATLAHATEVAEATEAATQDHATEAPAQTDTDDARKPAETNVHVVYFSSVTGNTERFVKKLGFPSERIPLLPKDGFLNVNEPFVLVTPTYGGGKIKGAVPKQVIKFLNDETNRSQCVGVISAGNTNFGTAYCLAGDIIAAKLKVPHMYRFELLGTHEDVTKVQEGLSEFWQNI